MGGPAVAVIVVVVPVQHHRAGPAVAEGGVAVRLDHKGKIAVQVQLPELLPGEHLGDAVDALVPHVVQQAIHLFIEGLVRRVLQIHQARQSAGEAVGLPVQELALRPHGDEPCVRQEHVQIHSAHNVQLAVVAGEDKVGHVQVPVALHGLHQLADPVVRPLHLVPDRLGKHAGPMAEAVDIGGVDHHQVRGVLFQNVQGAAHGEIVAVGMGAEHHAVHVLPDDLHHLRGAAASGIGLRDGVLRPLGPVLVDQVVDVGVSAGAGPVDRRGGIPGLLGGFENILLKMQLVVKPVPGGRQVSGDKVQVPRKAVLVGIHAAGHGGMAGIGDGGIDGADLFDPAAAAEILPEIGQCFQISQVLIDHGVR